MKHRHLKTEEWSRMAIDSLFERGKLPEWREFVSVLVKDKHLAEETLAVCSYHRNTGSAMLARVLVEGLYPEIIKQHN